MSLTPSHLLDQLRPWLAAPCWWLGFSGGMDSTVLLHLLANLRQQTRIPPLRVLHINHGIHAEAGQWARHCADTCAALELPFSSHEVELPAGGAGPEAAARAARYGVFEAELGAGELLLLAHHADDQVETFFLRLMRGAGTDGLQGMPNTRPLGRGALLRPLLEYPRSALETYAREHALSWIEDPSNGDTAPDRNYLRHEVLPRLQARWPGYRGSILHAIDTVTDTAAGFAEHYRELLDSAAGVSRGEPTLDLEVLADSNQQLLARLIRLWLAGLGLPVPGRKPLQELVKQLGEAAAPAAPQLSFSGYCLQRFQHRLFLYRPLAADFAPQRAILRPGESLAVAGLGQLTMLESAAGGVCLPAAGCWELRWRQGGERCQPCGRGHSQSLKKLLLEYGVPPWQRAALPLVYAGDELVAVADIWVCEGFAAGPGETGYQLLLQPQTAGPE